MLKYCAVALFAIAMSAGSADAKVGRSSSLTHAHFPTCAEGLVKAICVCRSVLTSNSQQLCRSGRYCHTFDGACRQ